MRFNSFQELEVLLPELRLLAIEHRLKVSIPFRN